jgi:excisionase family DNA binding protein
MDGRIAFTPREACEALRIGRTKLYELLAAREIKAIALGGKTLILGAELERFLNELPPIPLQKALGSRSASATRNSK